MFATELKQYIYENKKIEYVLQSLGCGHITYHNSGRDYWSANFPDGDNPNGINIKDNEYLNYCSWSRNVSYDEGQDLISLVEYINKTDFKTSLKWLHEILDLNYEIKNRIYSSKSKSHLKDKALSIFTQHLQCNHPVDAKAIEVIDDSILNEYVPLEYIGFLKEGITPYTCRIFNIEYSYRRKRIMIPIKLWNTGQIVGMNARTTIEGYEELGINKYSFSKGYNKSINLYGLWENYDAIQRKGYVCVYESEKSVLKRHSQFDGTGVALSGKIISEEQKRILIGLNVDIIIALDNDVGINEVYCLCEKFYGIRNIYFIKDNQNILGKKDSPADVCEMNYKKLFSNKIKYNKILHEDYLKNLMNKKVDK